MPPPAPWFRHLRSGERENITCELCTAYVLFLLVEEGSLAEMDVGHLIKDNNFSLGNLEENIQWKGTC